MPRTTASKSRPAALHRARAFGLTVSVAIGLSGCSGVSAPMPVHVAPTIASPGRDVVNVADAETGTTISLAPTQVLVVRLTIEPAAATTGFDWSLVDLPRGVLVASASTFERAPRNRDSEESAGSLIWRFSPLAPGTVALHFDLRRPHSLEPALQSLTYTVTVK